ncbi:MAG TPA: DnaJ C-terminal domain-containing protein [Myxococcota bacterium]|nr:DnaJ C-terminal domain-containing protein [Myxococcota bacterium]
MARRDLYEVLGVARDADAAAIKKAYRKLARELHPDVNPGDDAAEARFKEVSEAYSVLSDEEKKRNYDEFGDVSLEGGFDAEAARRAKEAFGARFGGGGGAGPGGFEAFFGGGGPGGGEEMHFGGDLDDLLSRLTGRGRGGGPRGPRRGHDLEAELELELRDAALGCERRLTLARPTAGGSRTETVTVKVPPGMVDGARIRIPGKGAEGPGGGPAGDLHATIRVRRDPLFRAEGRDLHLELPVTFAEATLGAEIEVPTLDGRATLTLPPGTDGGQRLRLRGKGIPGAGRHGAGDLYVTVRIRVPRDLDDAGRARVEAVAELGPADPRKGLA